MHSKVADQEIAENQKVYEHDGAVIKHDNPLLARYRYIESKGHKREWQQTERTELSGDCSLKKVNQLTEAKAFMEAMGPGDSCAASATMDLKSTHACTCMYMHTNTSVRNVPSSLPARRASSESPAV